MMGTKDGFILGAADGTANANELTTQRTEGLDTLRFSPERHNRFPLARGLTVARAVFAVAGVSTVVKK